MGNCLSESDNSDAAFGEQTKFTVIFCLLCKEHLNSDNFITLDDCLHSFCKDCLRDWVSNDKENPDAINSICPSNSLTEGNCNGVMSKSKLMMELMNKTDDEMNDDD